MSTLDLHLNGKKHLKRMSDLGIYNQGPMPHQQQQQQQFKQQQQQQQQQFKQQFYNQTPAQDFADDIF